MLTRNTFPLNESGRGAHNRPEKGGGIYAQEAPEKAFGIGGGARGINEGETHKRKLPW